MKVIGDLQVVGDLIPSVVEVGETGGDTFTRPHKLKFNAADGFYLTPDSRGNPVVNLSGSGSGTITGGTALGGTEPVFAGTVAPNLTFKGLTAGTGISLASDANAITITSTAAGGGGGFYGITVGQTNNAPSYKNINTVKFLATDFYVTQNSPNTDEVIVSLRNVVKNPYSASRSFASSNEWQFFHGLNTRDLVWSVVDTSYQAFIPQRVDLSDPTVAYFYLTPASAGRATVVG